MENKLIINHYEKLGILGARKQLRKDFLATSFNYIIMFDDDAVLKVAHPHLIDEYLQLMEKNPNGFAFISREDRYERHLHRLNPYNPAQLNFCAISRMIYEKEPFPEIDPQKNDGYEDCI